MKEFLIAIPITALLGLGLIFFNQQREKELGLASEGGQIQTLCTGQKIMATETQFMINNNQLKQRGLCK